MNRLAGETACPTRRQVVWLTGALRRHGHSRPRNSSSRSSSFDSTACQVNRVLGSHSAGVRGRMIRGDGRD